MCVMHTLIKRAPVTLNISAFQWCKMELSYVAYDPISLTNKRPRGLEGLFERKTQYV